MAGADSPALREAIVATARGMNALGINRAMAGNVSARIDGGFQITPSALPYDEMRPADIVTVHAGGRAIGRLVPSSEWRFHRAIYASRPEVEAIVHAHSTFATTLACLDRGIPAFHYMVAVAGGSDIRCAFVRYIWYTGTCRRGLARAGWAASMPALAPWHDCRRWVAQSALARAVEVETLAEIYWRALQIGEPTILSEDDGQRVVARFVERELTRSVGVSASRVSTLSDVSVPGLPIRCPQLRASRHSSLLPASAA